jgi:hypothetical protein
MPSIAPTKHPFHNRYTGSENKNPRPATTRSIIPIDPIIFSILCSLKHAGEAIFSYPCSGVLGLGLV